jgi:AcrR family transcriptional regulator
VRVRTEAKRQDIIDVASELFQENGYDRTSMSMISERLGGSKATLYGYFRSKDELLHAVLDYDVTEQAGRLMQEFLGSKDLRQGLINLGIAYMTRRLAKGPITNVRIISNQPAESDIGKQFYERVLRPAWMRLANRMEVLMEEGLLKRGDPWVMAMQWKGMCEWDMFERRLLGAISEGDPQEIKRASTHAADAFLAIYGKGNGGKKTAGQKAAQAKKVTA